MKKAEKDRAQADFQTFCAAPPAVIVAHAIRACRESWEKIGNFLRWTAPASVILMMDPAPFGRLVEEHAPALMLYARQWCPVPEDVVQEAFLKLIGQRQPPPNVVPWLFRVVRNQAISAARAALRRKRHETAVAAQTASWFVPAAEAVLDGQAVTQALHALPAEEREVITLHLWGGLTFAEVAEVVDCSASTAHRLFLRGVEHLRHRLHVPCQKTENQR